MLRIEYYLYNKCSFKLGSSAKSLFDLQTEYFCTKDALSSDLSFLTMFSFLFPITMFIFWVAWVERVSSSSISMNVE